MGNIGKNTLLLMMGGTGSRAGGDIPKQYVEINGKPVFKRIVEKYSVVKDISHICIVSNPEWTNYVEDVISNIVFHGVILVTKGGANRSESVKNGLKAIEGISSDEDVILIHDATHPYVDEDTVREVIDAVNEVGGATAGGMEYDTCYMMDEEGYIDRVVPRQYLVSGASPEAFKYGDLSRIYFTASDAELSGMTSAGAMALACHIPMKVVPMRKLNLKLTYKEDLELYECIADRYF